MGPVEDCLRSDYPRLVRAVAPAAASVADAEDAVQEAFARAWERIDRGEQINSLPAWIVTVALNLLRNRWRRLRHHGDADLTLLPEHVVDREALLDLHAAVRVLPLRQQQSVVLHYLLGFDVDSVAMHLGVSPGTVKTALSRARQSLANSLREVEPNER